MSIKSINLDLCDGCGDCIDSCPADVLRIIDNNDGSRLDTWKVQIAYPQECHSCGLCEMDCHVDAIKVDKDMALPLNFVVHERFVFSKFRMNTVPKGKLGAAAEVASA
jgi:NAD-dependent dihydropyrimidine dehydrogenase PreA subunit